MKIKKELVGASTSLLILGVVSKSPSYGYQIIKNINGEGADVFTWQEGTIYPVLHKLEKEGYLRSQWQTAESGRRRKYYYITQKGMEAIADCSNQWNEFHRLVLRLTEVQYV